jgi:YD repeat-containing protein
LHRLKRIPGSIVADFRRRLYAPPLILLCLATFAAAQVVTSRYVYDEDGRLRAVIAPGGEAAVYEYDPAGNFVAVRRLDADSLEVLTFTPRSGVPGTRVVFYGVGFGSGVSAVTFGGMTGALIGFTNNTITALVPEGATTGPVTITTARGTLTTIDPFVVQGIILNPPGVSVFGEDSAQFNATVILPGDDKEIFWSVNGIEGGNDAVGRITSEGLYTAPPDPPATLDLTVQAASVAFPSITGAASVRVRSFLDFRFTASPGVSVGKGSQYDLGVLSTGIAIGKGNEFATAFSSRIAIGKGDNFTATFSPGISLGKGERFIYGAAISQGVSLTKGPIITSISPGTMAQGSNYNMTISGARFSGADNVLVFNPDGSAASGISVSNINVSGDGRSLAVLLSITANSSTGHKIVVIKTPMAHSITSDVNVNTVHVTAR